MWTASLSSPLSLVHSPSFCPLFDKEPSHIKQNVIFGSLMQIFGVKMRNEIHSSHCIPLATSADEPGFELPSLGPVGRGSELLIRARLA